MSGASAPAAAALIGSGEAAEVNRRLADVCALALCGAGPPPELGGLAPALCDPIRPAPPPPGASPHVPQGAPARPPVVSAATRRPAATPGDRSPVPAAALALLAYRSPPPAAALASAAPAAAAREYARWKDGMAGAYLGAAEAAVDVFLARLGFAAGAVPADYLDRPPADLSAVARNAEVLQHCAAEAFNPASGFRALVDGTAAAAWAAVLHPMRRDMEALAAAAQKQAASRIPISAAATPPPADGPGGWTPAGEGSGLLAVGAAAAKDVAHLAKMLALEATWLAADDEAEGGGSPRRRQLSDVVPVAGLAVGRVHRLLNEHETVLAHWRRPAIRR